MATANMATDVENAARKTDAVIKTSPAVMATSRLARSTYRPTIGDSNPANSPMVKAIPISATETSSPRAMTAINGGANL
jgi:hypothetical protein